MGFVLEYIVKFTNFPINSKNTVFDSFLGHTTSQIDLPKAYNCLPPDLLIAKLGNMVLTDLVYDY